jgi:hypothetical protein
MNLEDAFVTPGDPVHLQHLRSKPKALLGDTHNPEVASQIQRGLVGPGLEHCTRWYWEHTVSSWANERSSELIRFPRSGDREADRNVYSHDGSVGMFLKEFLESSVDAASFDQAVMQGDRHPAASVGIHADDGNQFS